MNDEQFYKESIVEMIYSIRNMDWLRSIYSFIKVFADRTGRKSADVKDYSRA